MVQTTNGPVSGLEEDGLTVYRGIPYARAPFGELRFRAPVPPQPWTQTFAATEFGATAPQKVYANKGGLPDVPEPIIAGEDILTVNVWTPDHEPEQPMPVLVWIHGGGFVAGCSANPWYDGTSFANHGMVVVSFNYRLGAEGFLSIPGADTNVAVRDWIAALNWVQDNVAVFGGDPAQVTVMGQSAGGMALSALLSSPKAEGLFHRAIIASGIVRANVQSAGQAQENLESIAGILGIEPTLAAFAAVDPDDLVAAQDTYSEGVNLMDSTELANTDERSIMPWISVIDGDLLSQPILEAVRAGHGSNIPVLVGTTENEFAWIAIRENRGSEAARKKGQDFVDAFFRRPLNDFAEARKDAAAPTYRYEFQWKSESDPVVIGSGHSIDIPFFFNTLDAPYIHPYTGSNPPQKIADAMHGSFARFALTGDPGWPAYSDESDDAVMIFDNESRVVSGLTFD